MASMKRRYVVCILALTTVAACLLLSAIGWIVMLLPPGVMKDDADRIAVGMTLEQVTEILGRQADGSGKVRNIGGAASGVMHVWNVENPVGIHVGAVSVIVNDADSKVSQTSFHLGKRIMLLPWQRN
jgi:hypothetical protein